jgi:lipopolysaccharide transport system ATP-binding protein
VARGEILGIIGRNGAGKSTLLKILSRITTPTHGEALLRGRVASLLEVGTGFHPELTGRDNIYLNGAILGMKREEVAAKFDEIVGFAEIEEFIDTPVKRYSSGMYVRLAFAVAAHLEPEILIVDEVLAVGDAKFQEKCIGRIQDVSRNSGRTVLFVSHNASAIQRLCSRVILLESGKIAFDGDTFSGIARYVASTEIVKEAVRWPEGRGPASELVELFAVEMRDAAGTTNAVFRSNESISVAMRYVLKEQCPMIANIHIADGAGNLLFIVHDWFSDWGTGAKPAGGYETVLTVPGDFLNEGSFRVRAALSTYNPFRVHVDCQNAVGFSVVDSGGPLSLRGPFQDHIPGVLRPRLPIVTRKL